MLKSIFEVGEMKKPILRVLGFFFWSVNKIFGSKMWNKLKGLNF